MKQEIAETEALQALGWLVSQDELVGVFMGSSGLAANDLQANAADPTFLASVLDFLMMDDAWIIALCDAIGWDYSHPMQLRAALPGGGEVHWT